jgi:hypothetical protein
LIATEERYQSSFRNVNAQRLSRLSEENWAEQAPINTNWMVSYAYVQWSRPLTSTRKADHPLRALSLLYAKAVVDAVPGDEDEAYNLRRCIGECQGMVKHIDVARDMGDYEFGACPAETPLGCCWGKIADQTQKGTM